MKLKLKIKNYKSSRFAIKIHNGFTVVELLIYMALLTIFLLVLLDVFTTTLNFKLQSEATSALNQDSRSILGNLNYNIYNSGTATIVSSSKLSLDSGTKVYELSGGNLLLNSVKLNSLDTKVDSITFTKIGQTIQITFTLESLITTSGGPRTQTMNTTLGLRY
ncbi:MAG: prepilin-type N-terminal cleavage/methylation domain-containing protein [Candidatus Woesebacteria bacterium]|nr:MAG: prepilin-type N-terminal cleavage/methylation domain-containing protein [Candidatus Woesebacteria bacterium]